LFRYFYRGYLPILRWNYWGVIAINEVPVLFIREYLFEIFVLIWLIFNSHTIWIHACLERNDCYSEEFFLLRHSLYIRHLRLEKSGLHWIENRDSPNIVGQNRTMHNLISLFWHEYIVTLNFSMNNSSWRLWLDCHTILLIESRLMLSSCEKLFRFNHFLGMSKEMSLLIFS
jgi:hypothetical protein